MQDLAINDMRELSMEEIDEVSGGVAPIIAYGSAYLVGVAVGVTVLAFEKYYFK